jgi:hypothetical protein
MSQKFGSFADFSDFISSIRGTLNQCSRSSGYPTPIILQYSFSNKTVGIRKLSEMDVVPPPFPDLAIIVNLPVAMMSVQAPATSS